MLQISRLSKTYPGGKKAVSSLSLHVEPGDIYGFIGPNGAGKTTTLQCIAGILPFEEGEIRIDGHSVREEALVCKSLTAYIPDNPDLCEYLTGSQYLDFIADVYRVDAAARAAVIERYARSFEIYAALGDLISSYSHGMKQKLAILSALIHAPRLLLLDEPFVGLDPKAALLLKETMRELCGRGCAIFFSTHVLDVAEKLCNKVAILRAGALAASGPMEELTGDASLEALFMEVAEHAQGH